MISGTVRGQKIHFACATEEEIMLTWLNFWDEERAPDENCERCGRPLKEVPDP